VEAWLVPSNIRLAQPWPRGQLPCTAIDGTCKPSFIAAIPRGDIIGYSVGNFLFGASKIDMQPAIQQQPVSIAIEIDQYAFQAYKSVVLSYGCGTSLDHGVLAVGYDIFEVEAIAGDTHLSGEDVWQLHYSLLHAKFSAVCQGFCAPAPTP